MNAGAIILIILVIAVVVVVLFNLTKSQTNPNAYQQCLSNCQSQDQLCQQQYGSNSVYCQGQLGVCNTACGF